MQNQDLTIPEGYDPVAVNVARAIRQHESGGDYSKSGDNGTSHGAYMWQQDTWNKHAQEAGLDPNDFSPKNQDNVAYKVIENRIKAGKTLPEIAAEWNSGSSEGWQTKKGVKTYPDGTQIPYDVPAYVNSVNNIYQDLKEKTQGMQQQQPQQPITPTEPTLGQNLAGRVKDISGAITETAQGKQGIGSGILQSAGAIAGGLGDVTNAAIETIPGVKQVEGLIGKGVGKLAKTSAGKSVTKAIGEFSQVHPEASKDIGAVFNIATALPILKGFGVAKNLALDAASSALKNQAEKTVLKDLTDITAKTVAGRNMLKSEGNNAIKTLVNERTLPEIVDNKYSTQNAFDSLSQKISDIEDNKLQPELQKVATTGVDTRRPIEDLRQQALKRIKSEFKSSGNVGSAEKEVNRIFDDYKNSYGDYVTLQDATDMKRGIRNSVNFNSPKLDSDVSYHIGQVLQKDVEDSAARLGLKDVGAINKEMQALIKAQKALKHIEGKSVKMGLVGETVKNVATGAGELAGNASGIPFAGAFAGRQGGGFVGKKLSGIGSSILKRTGPEAVRTTAKEATKGIGGLIKGALAQKAAKSQK